VKKRERTGVLHPPGEEGEKKDGGYLADGKRPGGDNMALFYERKETTTLMCVCKTGKK